MIVVEMSAPLVVTVMIIWAGGGHGGCWCGMMTVMVHICHDNGPVIMVILSPSFLEARSFCIE